MKFLNGSCPRSTTSGCEKAPRCRFAERGPITEFSVPGLTGAASATDGRLRRPLSVTPHGARCLGGPGAATLRAPLGSEPEADPGADVLAVFAVLWAAATLSQSGSTPGRRESRETRPCSVPAMSPAPGRAGRAVSPTIAAGARGPRRPGPRRGLDRAPVLGNHWLLAALVNLGLLLALLIGLRGDGIDGARVAGDRPPAGGAAHPPHGGRGRPRLPQRHRSGHDAPLRRFLFRLAALLVLAALFVLFLTPPFAWRSSASRDVTLDRQRRLGPWPSSPAPPCWLALWSGPSVVARSVFLDGRAMAWIACDVAVLVLVLRRLRRPGLGPVAAGTVRQALPACSFSFPP